MNTDSTVSYCGTPIINGANSGNFFCTTLYCNIPIYEDFLNSFDKIKDKNMLMFHSPSEIYEASRLFPGYLTDEELQEKQYKGRFWTIYSFRNVNSCSYISGSFIYYLYILVDNETVVIVDTKGETKISGRECLPTSLQGRHYYDEC